MTIKLFGAIDFCIEAHRGQKRKYSGEDYATHPMAVAMLCQAYMLEPDAVIAAVLHDVIEDTDTTIDEIECLFGESVAKLVLEVTDVSKPSDGNRKVRKQKDLEHLAKASHLGKSIKLADLIHNTQSIVKHDIGFAKIYLEEKTQLLKVLKDGNGFLYQMAMHVLEEGKKCLK